MMQQCHQSGERDRETLFLPPKIILFGVDEEHDKEI